MLWFLVTTASVWATGGWRLAAGLMPILLAHEMGHYVACRHHRVDATLPFFLPAPLVSLVGTFGAFIRIRSPFPSRKALFDIGIAGPLAGFVIAMPVLVLGILEAETTPKAAAAAATQAGQMITLGDPLLFTWAAQWLRPEVASDVVVTIGPLGLAAWFGLLVTALNLMPVGQLDGGHTVYAVSPRAALPVSTLIYAGVLALLFRSPVWLLWALLLTVVGRRHPPTLDDVSPLDARRRVVAAIGLAIFIVCFTPEPFQATWGQTGDAFRELIKDAGSWIRD